MRRRFALFKRRCYEILDVGSTHDGLSIFVHRVLVSLIFISLFCAIFETVPYYMQHYSALFHVIDTSIACLFLIEYILRLYAITEHPPLRGGAPWRVRLVYAATPMMIIDLLSLLPLASALWGSNDLQVLIILRLLRFFKLARYSPGMRSLFDALYGERRALLACLLILGGLVIFAASTIHFIEGRVQPEKFGTIPDCMYWAIVTLTTVGYGDVVPITPLGKVAAGLTAASGWVMISLPVGIIATAFSETIHKRDFVVTWNMVSRVPLFSELSAGEIADVMRYLRSRMYEEGQVIVRRDEHAHSMYFIASGSVEIELEKRRIRLDEGQFFGELAILREGKRNSNVRALTATRLLVLDREDFMNLLDHNAGIAKHIQETVKNRLEVPISDV